MARAWRNFDAPDTEKPEAPQKRRRHFEPGSRLYAQSFLMIAAAAELAVPDASILIQSCGGSTVFICASAMAASASEASPVRAPMRSRTIDASTSSQNPQKA